MRNFMGRIGQKSITSGLTYYYWLYEHNRIYPENIISSVIQSKEHSNVIEIMVMLYSGSA